VKPTLIIFSVILKACTNVLDLSHLKQSETDETGLTNVQSPSRIVSQKGTKQIGSAASEYGQQVTLIVAVNAVGYHISPKSCTSNTVLSEAATQVLPQVHLLSPGPSTHEDLP
jgi:hypothetical protein